MDKEFFATIEDRRAEYVKRAGVEAADIQVSFHGGRTLLIETVVEVSDTWLIVEGRDQLDEQTPIGFATAYHQVASVQFLPHRERIGRTGF